MLNAKDIKRRIRHSWPRFLKKLDYEIYGHSKNWITLDVETTNLDKGDPLNLNNELLVWVAKKAGAIAHGNGTKKSLENLISWIKDCDFIVCHSGKFELGWLYRYGLEPGSVLLYDTMLGEKCLAGNRRWAFDLDSTCLRYGLDNKQELVARQIRSGVCPSEIAPQRLLDYCTQDVIITEQLFLKQRPLLKNLWPVVFTRCLTSLVLADIERNGMFLDKEAVQQEYRKALTESLELQAKIHELSGGINPDSPKQVGEFLYDNLGFEEAKDYKGDTIKTDGGARKTSEDVILLLKARTKEQKEFLDVYKSYIPYEKRVNTLSKLSECSQADGKLFFNFNQHIAATHRLSSNGKRYKIQGQNIDRDFKRLFRSRTEEWVVADGDAPQLEFRTAVQLGNDAQGKLDIKNKHDVHRATASILQKKAPEVITKDERTEAKPNTFRPLYGGKSGDAALRAYIAYFQDRYKKIFQTQTSWTYEVLKEKKLKLASGLIFYWPECKMSRSSYISFTTDIFNYPVQSLASAEIIGASLVYLWYLMQSFNMQGFIVNTVHDSIVAELPQEEVELWNELARLAFTDFTYNYLDKVYGIKMDVPLGVSLSADIHWGQGKDVDYEKDPTREKSISSKIMV